MFLRVLSLPLRVSDSIGLSMPLVIALVRSLKHGRPIGQELVVPVDGKVGLGLAHSIDRCGGYVSPLHLEDERVP